VSVEFAVALPVVVLVLTTLVAAVLVVDGLGRLHLAAASVARAEGRGDSDARGAAERSVPDAAVTVHRDAGLVCVTLDRRGSGPFAVLPLSVTECAVDGGR